MLCTLGSFFSGGIKPIAVLTTRINNPRGLQRIIVKIKIKSY